jgi:hypothetical protein
VDPHHRRRHRRRPPGTLLAQVLGVETTPGIDWIELVMQVVLAVVGVGLVAGLRRGSGRSV